jgi:hypothetical protein
MDTVLTLELGEAISGVDRICNGYATSGVYISRDASFSICG